MSITYDHRLHGLALRSIEASKNEFKIAAFHWLIKSAACGHDWFIGEEASPFGA